MPKIALYKVGVRGRIQLEGIADEGDHYTVDRDDEGVITLTPVEVHTTSAKRNVVDELPI